MTRPQFSLRFLFVLTAIAAAVFGLFRWNVESHRTRLALEQDMLRSLQDAGARVSIARKTIGWWLTRWLTGETVHDLPSGSENQYDRYHGGDLVGPFNVIVGLDAEGLGDPPSPLVALHALPDVRRVRLRYGLADTAISAIEHCSQIRELALNDMLLDTNHMEVVATLTQLESLDVSRTQLTHGGIRSIASLKRLRYLNLSDLDFPDTLIDLIATLPRLESLSVHDSHLSNAGIQRIAQLPTLKSLRVSSCTLTQMKLSQCDHLETLLIAGGPLKSIELSAFPALEDLSFNTEPLSDLRLKSIPRLTVLKLHLIESDFIELRDLAFLREVYLGRNKQIVVKGLPRLEVLSIDGAALGGIAFAELPSLKCLSVFGGDVTAANLRKLSDCRRLEFLQLVGCRLEPSSSCELSALRGLRALDVSSSNIDDGAIDAFLQLPVLESIRVSDTQISREGIERLRVAIPNVDN